VFLKASGSRRESRCLVCAHSELFGVRAKRVDLLRRTVSITDSVVDVCGHLHFGPPKTRAGRRIVPLPRVAAELLADHLTTYARKPDDLVFTAPDSGPVQLNLRRLRS
jgi:integrase